MRSRILIRLAKCTTYAAVYASNLLGGLHVLVGRQVNLLPRRCYPPIFIPRHETTSFGGVPNPIN